MVHIVTVYKLVNNGRVQILLVFTVGQAGVGMGYLGMVEMGRGGGGARSFLVGIVFRLINNGRTHILSLTVRGWG